MPDKVESTGKDTSKVEEPIELLTGDKQESSASAAAKPVSSPVNAAKAEQKVSITFLGQINRVKGVMAFGRVWEKGKVYEVSAAKAEEILQNPDFSEVK